MMQIRVSVFFQGGYLSYEVNSEDKKNFHFSLKTAPAQITNAPDNFNVTQTGRGQFTADHPLDADFQQSLFDKMKTIKL